MPAPLLPASHGIVLFRPSFDISPQVHCHKQPRPLASGHGHHSHIIPFHPCGFSPLRRLAPCRAPESIAPRYQKGFATFPPKSTTQLVAKPACDPGPRDASTLRRLSLVNGCHHITAQPSLHAVSPEPGPKAQQKLASRARAPAHYSYCPALVTAAFPPQLQSRTTATPKRPLLVSAPRCFPKHQPLSRA